MRSSSTDPEGPDKLEQTLSAYHRTGAWESTGSFTISLDKAEEKLTQHQLPEPRAYVLNLVAAAVQGRASRFEVTLAPGRCDISFNGRAFSRAELNSLLQELLSPSDRRLQELAVALYATRALPGVQATFESWSDLGGLRYKVGEQIEETTANASPLVNRLTATEPSGIPSRLGAMLRKPVEHCLLEQQAQHAPLALTINGERISRSLALEQKSKTLLASLHLRLPNNSRLPTQTPHSQWHPHATFRSVEPIDEWEAVLCFDGEGTAHDFLFILNGVTFPRRSVEFAGRFVRGAVTASHLSKDLSHGDIVQDSLWNKMVTQVIEVSDDLIVRRLKDRLLVPDEASEKLAQWLPELEARLKRRGDQQGLKAIRQWLSEFEFRRNLDNDRRWKELLNAYQELGEGSEKEHYRDRLTHLHLTSIHLAVGARDFHRASQYSGRVCLLWTSIDPSSYRDFFQLWRLSSALCGQTIDHSVDDEVESELLRLQGSPDSALSRAKLASQRGLISLALEDFPSAQQQLRHALTSEPDDLETNLALIHGLLWAPGAQSSTRKEALARLEGLLEQSDPLWRAHHLESLTQAASGITEFPVWLRFRSRLSLTQEAFPSGKPFLKELDSHLERLSRSPTALPTITGLLLKMERTLSNPDHQAVVRARAVAGFRKRGYWREADYLVVRGRLTRRLDQLVQALSP